MFKKFLLTFFISDNNALNFSYNYVHKYGHRYEDSPDKSGNNYSLGQA